MAGCPSAILDSREQLVKAGTAIDPDWGVVGCTHASKPEEIPMVPITVMGNALGLMEGGSGVPQDHAARPRGLAFWGAHAN